VKKDDFDVLEIVFFFFFSFPSSSSLFIFFKGGGGGGLVLRFVIIFVRILRMHSRGRGDEGTKQTQTLSEREWNAFVRNEEFFSTDRQQTEKESFFATMREELDFNEKRDDRTRERKG